jgi:pyruvate dehydrogenase E1 component
LGTDGFGRSDTREQLRDFFEVDRRWIVITALRSLVDAGQLDRQKLAEALKKYNIDIAKPNPMTV